MLKRIIHSVSFDRKMLVLGTRSLLVEKAFTVASIDNIDFLKSNVAIIYSGDQHRSWHATSIQLIQLMPSTSVHSQQSRAVRRLFNTREATTSESNESSYSNMHMCLHHQACCMKPSKIKVPHCQQWYIWHCGIYWQCHIISMKHSCAKPSAHCTSCCKPSRQQQLVLL